MSPPQPLATRQLPWAVSLALTAIASPAQAERTQVGPMEEMVVTASRSAERVMDSPASLSILNEEDIARATTPLLADLMRDLPGIRVSDSGQPGLSRIRIRGEESRRTAILINGQEVTDHYEVGTPLTLHPTMVERVEVIRGSGSVLYGSRALSGVVNFLTRKGGTEPVEATVSGGYNGATRGEDLFASVYGNVSGLEYRFAWSDSDHEERQSPEGEIENTAFDSNSLYAYLGRGFGDHRFEYIYDNYESSSDIFVEEAVRTSPPLLDFYLETPQRDRQRHSVFYNWEIDNSWLRLISANASTQQSDRHFYTRTELDIYVRDINNFSELNTDGALLQFDLQPVGGHSLIAGIQYLNDDVDQTRHVDTVSSAPPIPSGTEIINDRANIETWAWFVQDQWSLHPDVTLTAGLRQYFVEGELEDSNRESLTPGSLDKDDELIGSLGLVWATSDTLSLRANVSEGYVYPSLLQLATGAYAGSRFVNPEPGLTPETSINYELGLRLQRTDLTLDATAFYTESDDYIDDLPCTAQDNCPGSRDRRYLNVGESTAHGIELFTSYTGLPANLETYGNLTWMERRNDYENFSTRDTGIPQFSGRAGLRWAGSVERLQGVWVDGYLRGETKSDLEEPGTVRNVLESKSGWVTANIAGGINFGRDTRYQLSVELFNLFDKTYIASGENLYGIERSAALKLTVSM